MVGLLQEVQDQQELSRTLDHYLRAELGKSVDYGRKVEDASYFRSGEGACSEAREAPRSDARTHRRSAVPDDASGGTEHCNFPCKGPALRISHGSELRNDPLKPTLLLGHTRACGRDPLSSTCRTVLPGRAARPSMAPRRVRNQGESVDHFSIPRSSERCRPGVTGLIVSGSSPTSTLDGHEIVTR